MLSEIIINDMEFFSYHGFYPEEQKIGCKYTIDLILKLSLDEPCKSDKLDTTVNYEDVYTLVRHEMNYPSKLIENVASRIITTLKERYTQIEHIDIKLYKYNPSLGGQVGRVGIHLYE